MRGLTIIAAGTDRIRFHTALTMAAAQAAMGGQAILFVDGAAVALLADQPEPSEDTGTPQLGDLITTALELGVQITACQSGLASAGITLSTLDPRIAGGGLVSVMAALGESRLIVV